MMAAVSRSQSTTAKPATGTPRVSRAQQVAELLDALDKQHVPFSRACLSLGIEPRTMRSYVNRARFETEGRDVREQSEPPQLVVNALRLLLAVRRTCPTLRTYVYGTDNRGFLDALGAVDTAYRLRGEVDPWSRSLAVRDGADG